MTPNEKRAITTDLKIAGFVKEAGTELGLISVRPQPSSKGTAQSQRLRGPNKDRIRISTQVSRASLHGHCGSPWTEFGARGVSSVAADPGPKWRGVTLG